MRKIIVLTFLSLDGVMQSPGAPTEDPSGDFNYGGWVVPYFDEFSGQMMTAQMQPADLLLGRKTFNIFASYWPKHEKEWSGINEVNKYVVSTTLTSSDWNNSIFFNNIEEIKKLKKQKGRDIQVHGSGNLIQSLLKHNLVDELWLKFFPITLGKGKRLFTDEIPAAAFTLTECKHSPSGVIFANYKRAGEIKTGSF